MSNDKDKPKKRKIIDKILLGAIIGGAIGSVVGVTIAPKEGKETRQEIKENLMKAGEKSKNIFKKIIGIFKKGEKDEAKKIPHETNQP